MTLNSFSVTKKKKKIENRVPYIYVKLIILKTMPHATWHHIVIMQKNKHNVSGGIVNEQSNIYLIYLEASQTPATERQSLSSQQTVSASKKSHCLLQALQVIGNR